MNSYGRGTPYPEIDERYRLMPVIEYGWSPLHPEIDGHYHLPHVIEYGWGTPHPKIDGRSGVPTLVYLLSVANFDFVYVLGLKKTLFLAV